MRVKWLANRFIFNPLFIAGAAMVTASISAMLFFSSTPEKQTEKIISIELHQEKNLFTSKPKVTDHHSTPAKTEDTFHKSEKKENKEFPAVAPFENHKITTSKSSRTEKNETHKTLKTS